MTYLSPDSTYVLLEDSMSPQGWSWLYRDPVDIICCETPEDWAIGLAALQDSVSSGLYAAGWVSYEAGYLMEDRLRPLLPSGRQSPLMWFGLFDRRDRLTRRQVESFWQEACRGRSGQLGPLVPSVGQADYVTKVAAIQECLAAGDVYQINYTFPMLGQAHGDPACIHQLMRQAQPVPWGAYIETPDFAISCHSPELFFEKQQDQVVLRPMKGTAPRGRWPAEDQHQCETLVQDDKSRAENLMIVDLERNDLSRIADPGSVDVATLFQPELYRSVIQMTSTVQGRVPQDIGIAAMLAALFPCGSVTGAPKIRAMEIIRQLEDTPRGVYTGAIGHITPQGDMAFNVPIRTLQINRDGAARLGIGSGIVADSRAGAEYDECLLKGSFAAEGEPAPCLIETIKWSAADGYWLLEKHLDRLQQSAAYLSYPLDLPGVEELLAQHADACAFQGAADTRRVRLLLSPGGDVSIKSSAFSPPVASSTKETAALSSLVVQSDDPWLCHKTTRRQHLDAAFNREAQPFGHRDVLLTNERGELTEGTRHNLFIRRGEKLVTPPLGCGLLPGTLRQHLFMSADSLIEEQILRPADLSSADAIYLGNSLNGLVEVEIVTI